MSAEADDLLARSAAVYAACSSYRDEGVVRTTFYSPRRRVESRLFFTHFVRNGGFLFEHRDRHGEEDWNRHVIWTEGDIAKAWWTLDPQRGEPGSLSSAIAGATGVSGGAAYTVPVLLMPDLYKDRPARPAPPAEIVDLPEAAAQNCFVVDRERGSNAHEQLWIDRQSLLIRRVVCPRRVLKPRSSEDIQRDLAKHPELAVRFAQLRASRPNHPPSEVESVTTYEPTLNAKIDPADLCFVPPSA